MSLDVVREGMVSGPRRSVGGRWARLRGDPLVWLGAATLAVALSLVGASFGHRSELDELYTLTLTGTPDLRLVWSGAMSGVDGNPPLYLSLAWLATRVAPEDPVHVLRLLNLALLAGAGAVVYRILRRVADPVSVAVGLVALCALDEMVPYALLEVRTYALYLLLVPTVLLAAVRVVDRPSPWRVAALAGLGVTATLAHGFGGPFVLATLGGAGLSCLLRGGRATCGALALAAVPAALTTAWWFHASVPVQTAIATPYGWITRPDVVWLLVALTGSLPSTALASLVLARLGLLRLWRLWRRWAPAPVPFDVAALRLALLGWVALTGVAWVGSHLTTPFFLPRYYAPDVVLGGLALVLGVRDVRRAASPAIARVLTVTVVGMALCALVIDGDTRIRTTPCTTDGEAFLEDGAVPAGLPVVAESPHAWLPRAHYALGRDTVYALDWGVVLRHPTMSTNNAMDHHIMEALRDWSPPGSPARERVLTTAEILARYPSFVVLSEWTRRWYDDLRVAVPVRATLLRETPTCRVWRVDVIRPARRDE